MDRELLLQSRLCMMSLAFLAPSVLPTQPATPQLAVQQPVETAYAGSSAQQPAFAAARAAQASACLAAGAFGLLAAGRRARRQRQQQRCRGSSAALRVTAVADKTEEDVAKLVQTEEPPENLREWRLQVADKLEKSGERWPAPKNDRLLRAARGEKVDRAPKWMMRQAGRYLPEYMHTLKTSDFFTVCQTPALAAEVTLQPLRRYPTLDAMIIFSDILVIPVAMGMPCRMEPAKGPQFDWALKTPEDMKKLNLTPDVPSSLGYVFDAIFWCRQRSENVVPTIGFCGAPWTLMGYMVEGGAVRSFDTAKKWLYLYPEASRQLLTALRDIIVQYLVGQYDSGAPLLTVFDTNCGEIPTSVYEDFMVADLKYIAEEVKRQRPDALLSVFPKDGELATFNDSKYDVVGVSWKTSPTQARQWVPDKTLQGNLDPTLLYASEEEITERAQRMVKEFGVDKYICNLGHGMLPTHPTDGPAYFHAAVNDVKRDDFPEPAHVASEPASTAAAGSTAAAAPGPQLTLHLKDDTSVIVPFSAAGATSMKSALAEFVALFKKKMASEVAQRWDDFEYTFRQDGLEINLYCNPNAHATIFDVKIFLTVKCGEQIKVTSEVPMSLLQADIQAFDA